MKLIQGTAYKAKIELGFFESLASNGAIRAKLEEAGFVNVIVLGGGGARYATGIWSLPTQEADLPSQVKRVDLDSV